MENNLNKVSVKGYISHLIVHVHFNITYCHMAEYYPDVYYV